MVAQYAATLLKSTLLLIVLFDLLPSCMQINLAIQQHMQTMRENVPADLVPAYTPPSNFPLGYPINYLKQ